MEERGVGEDSGEEGGVWDYSVQRRQQWQMSHLVDCEGSDLVLQSFSQLFSCLRGREGLGYRISSLSSYLNCIYSIQN